MHTRNRILALLFPIVALTGCQGEKPPPPTPKPAEVLVSRPVEQEVTDYEIFTGRTDADKRVELRSRVTGYLEKITFSDGAMVKENDLLFIIDPKPFKAELARAEANLAQARTKLRLAEAEAARAQALVNRQAISREDYERIVAALDETKAAGRVAESNVELARLNLTYTEIRAPFEGRMSRRMVDPGNLVKADETMLSTIVTTSPIDVYFDVDERTLLRRKLQAGALTDAQKLKIPVQIGLVDEEGTFPHKGTVSFLDNRLDTNTGSMWMRAQFDKPARPIAAGMFSRIRFLLGDPYKAILVAEQAVGTDQGQKFVFVINDKNRAEYRRVMVGQLHGARRVIKEGVEPGERVVVMGLQRIKVGDEVNPKEVPMPNGAEKPGADEDPAGKHAEKPAE